jgi:membrane associated rhomboid family serine protease
MSYALADEYEPQRATAPAVAWIIGLCVALAFLQETILRDGFLRDWLGFHAADTASRRLWTTVTYMFVHGGLLHLAFNMYMLWVFGRRVERAWGSSTFTWFYLWCGVSGWFFHWIFTGGGGVLVGASAAILGVAVAYAARWPDDELYVFGVVPMKVRWLVAFMAVLSVVMALLTMGSSSGGTAFAAHLGGMFGGWLYLRGPDAQSIHRLRRRIAPAPDYGDDTPRAVPRHSARPREREPELDDIVAQSKAAIARTRQQAPAAAAAPAAPKGAVTQRAAMDELLDKIAEQGMASLSSDERAQLEEMSRQLRGR